MLTCVLRKVTKKTNIKIVFFKIFKLFKDLRIISNRIVRQHTHVIWRDYRSLTLRQTILVNKKKTLKEKVDESWHSKA